MKYLITGALWALLFCAGAMADLKPDVMDCNPKKAARNAAMDATVGVSGKCDSGKAAKNAKEDAVDDVKDSVDLDHDQKNNHLGGDKDHKRLKNHKD